MKKATEETRAEARRLRKTGASYYAIAGVLRISEASARNYCKGVRKEAGAVPAAVTADDGRAVYVNPATASELSDDALTRAKKAYQRAVDLADRALSDGNTTAAQRAERDAATYSHQIVQLEKSRGDDADVWAAPRAEVEKAQKEMAELFRKLADDFNRAGLACPHCGRAIRTRIASEQHTQKDTE
jgi:hypothetical protein